MSRGWTNIEALKEASGWADRTIRAKRTAGEIVGRLQQQRGRNGKRAWKFLISSLPPDVQLKLSENAIAAQAHEVLLLPEKAGNTDLQVPSSSLVPVITSATKETNSGRRAIVPPEKRPQVDLRMKAIQPLLDWRKGTRPNFLDDDGTPFSTIRQYTDWLAKHGDPSTPRSTRFLWLQRWDEGGEPALASDIRKDKGKWRSLDPYPKAKRFLLAKFAEGQGRYSTKHICEMLKREWTQLEGDGSESPSLDTVRSFLKSIRPAIRDVVQCTRQEHDSKNAPYLVTKIEDVPVNHIWVADHRIYDVLTVNDCFDGAPRFSDIRLWETCIEDMRSRVIVGSVWSLVPSSRTIASALLQAIATYGLPDIFYVDNGKDFRKIGGKGRGGWSQNEPRPQLDEYGRVLIDPTADNLLARIGVQPKYCIPRHPQSKQIESYFATVSKRFDVMWESSYAGYKPEHRPEACREAEKRHKLFEKGQIDESPFVPASYFVAVHRQWVKEFNFAHEHGGRGMDGRSPLDVFNELLPPDQRRIPNMADLTPLFWDRRTYVVANSMVKVGEFRYEAADADTAKLMYLANQTQIRVACNPDHVAHAIAYDLDGKLLGCLKSQELAARGIESADQIKAIQRFRNRIFKSGKQLWKLMQEGVPTEVELLAARGNISRPVINASMLPQRQVLRLAAGAGATAPVYIGDAVDKILAIEEPDGANE